MKNSKYILLSAIISLLFVSHNSSFAQDNLVCFAWTPNTEPHLSHYVLYRDTDPGTYKFFTEIDKADSLYSDDTINPGATYYYKITAIDSFGYESAPSSEIEVKVEKESIPENEVTGVTSDYQLKQNYPNPFNPETNISYSLAKNTNVRLIIYDVMGKEVIRLVDNFSEAGNYNIRWNGRDSFGRRVASGVYYYFLHTEKFSSSKMMLVQK